MSAPQSSDNVNEHVNVATKLPTTYGCTWYEYDTHLSRPDANTLNLRTWFKSECDRRTPRFSKPRTNLSTYTQSHVPCAPPSHQPWLHPHLHPPSFLGGMFLPFFLSLFVLMEASASQPVTQNLRCGSREEPRNKLCIIRWRVCASFKLGLVRARKPPIHTQ